MAEQYRVRQAVEHRRMSKWMPGVISAVHPGEGPDGETLYTVAYTLPDGSRHVSRGHSARTVRIPAE